MHPPLNLASGVPFPLPSPFCREILRVTDCFTTFVHSENTGCHTWSVSAQATFSLPSSSQCVLRTRTLKGSWLWPSVRSEDWISSCWCLDSRTFCPVFCKSSHSRESSFRNLERSPSLGSFCSTSCCLLGWAEEGMDPSMSTLFLILYLGDLFREWMGQVQDGIWLEEELDLSVLGELLSHLKFLNEPYAENLPGQQGLILLRDGALNPYVQTLQGCLEGATTFFVWATHESEKC